MKKILYIVISIIYLSCAKDKALGPNIEVERDYIIPQGQSPADNRIVELFEKYGTYFLYNYTEADFNYTIVSSSSSTSNITTYGILGNPLYVGDMLDILNEIWLNFYPDEFLAENLPYRILLADTIKQVYSYERPNDYLYTRLTTNTIAISGLNENIKNMPANEKRKMKNDLQKNFFMNLLNNNKLSIPKEFYEISDYSSAADANSSSANFARARGFVPSIDNEDTYGTVSEWCTYVNYQTKRLSESDDLNHFIKNMICHAEDDPNSWGNYLTYPLVKQKHDILQEHFKKEYNIDLQAIGNANK